LHVGERWNVVGDFKTGECIWTIDYGGAIGERLIDEDLMGSDPLSSRCYIRAPLCEEFKLFGSSILYSLSLIEKIGSSEYSFVTLMP